MNTISTDAVNLQEEANWHRGNGENPSVSVVGEYGGLITMPAYDHFSHYRERMLKLNSPESDEYRRLNRKAMGMLYCMRAGRDRFLVRIHDNGEDRLVMGFVKECTKDLKEVKLSILLSEGGRVTVWFDMATGRCLDSVVKAFLVHPKV